MSFFLYGKHVYIFFTYFRLLLFDIMCKLKYILCWLVMLIPMFLMAQVHVPQNDTLSIYFHLDKTDIDMSLSNKLRASVI